MIVVVVDPRDPELEPLGVAADGSSVRPYTASIRPSRTVRLAGGGFLSAVMPKPRSASTDEPVSFTVPATDGAEIHADDRSTFTYIVDVDVAGGNGRGRGGSSRVTFTGLLPSSLGASVSVTALSAAEPLPAPFTSVQDIIDGVADVNDPVVSSLVSGATSTSTAIDSRLTSGPVATRQGVLVPASISHTDVQAALTAAASSGQRVQAAGAYTTSSTLTIKGDADLSGLTITYTGTGVAVLIDGPTATTRLDRKTINLPVVVCGTKPATGWVAGTVGVRARNVSACIITVPQVTGFEVGFDFTANVTGNVYNTITFAALDNNKVNHWINPTNGGWVNNNTFIGGRFSHYSAEGIAVAGTKHIYITQGTGTVSNMNVWINTSIETGPGIVEYGIDVEAGLYNVFQNPRVEANGTAPNDRVAVRWGPAAQKNVIRDGYSLSTKLRQVWAGGSANYIDSQSLVEHQASGATTPFRRYENATSSNGPVLGVYEAGTVSSTTAYNPDTDWSVWLSSTHFLGKRKADVNARIDMDWANGRVYFGTGSAAVTKYIGNFGSNLAVAGSSLLYATHNTYDLGSATQAPRYVIAGTAVVTGAVATGSRPTAASAGVGAMVFDTTLGKPIWSNGTVWKDATGTTV